MGSNSLPGAKLAENEVMGSNRMPVSRLLRVCFFVVLWLAFPSIALSADFNQPWRNKEKALVLDAYEKNPIDWAEVTKNKRIRGFIAKSSDGIPPPYSCSGDETKRTLCAKTFQNYWLKQQLYKTRRTVAKAFGLKWGAYHLGRPGNPIEQANHFIEFADPQPDELIALDIEHDDPTKWISFKDAEAFARHIYFRLGRYPILYTNHNTAQRIAARRAEFPLLSRLPLWYARYRSEIKGVFPMGNWDNYSIWQFSSGINCNKKKCLYRVKGTEPNIDVNVTPYTAAELEEKWPFNFLVPERKLPESSTEVLVAKKQVDVSQAVVTATFAVEIDVTRQNVKSYGIPVPAPSPAKEAEQEVAAIQPEKAIQHSLVKGPIKIDPRSYTEQAALSMKLLYPAGAL